jgi:hypothetical protein
MNRRSFMALVGLAPLLPLGEAEATETPAVHPYLQAPMCCCGNRYVREIGSDGYRRYRCLHDADPRSAYWHTPAELRAAADALEAEDPPCVLPDRHLLDTVPLSELPKRFTHF